MMFGRIGVGFGCGRLRFFFFFPPPPIFSGTLWAGFAVFGDVCKVLGIFVRFA